jgi:hypothetical protein
MSDVPLATFGAGLPNTPEHIMSAASFTERIDFQQLSPLDADEATRALLEPALQRQVSWDADAMAVVLEEAAGSPYLIQRLGDEAWMQADPQSGGVIDIAAAAEAVRQLRFSLNVGMYRGRWVKCPPHERALLVAMSAVADHSGVARIADIATTLEKAAKQLSVARESLMDKGIVESAGYGLLRFTMPGFGRFVLEQVAAKPAPTMHLFLE